MHQVIRQFLPRRLKEVAYKVLKSFTSLRTLVLVKKQPLKHKKALNAVRKQRTGRKIKIAFFALHSSVWKYGNVYRLLENDIRFDPIVIVCPVVNYGFDNMVLEMDQAYCYFKNNNYHVIRSFNKTNGEFLDIKKKIKPDIIFYTNPYEGLIDNRYYITQFTDTLTCYTNYGYGQSIITKLIYTTPVSNLCWKVFLETDYHLSMLSAHSRAKGINGVVTGYPGIDDIVFNIRQPDKKWKCPDLKLKRIIWAPHHAIDGIDLINYSTFLMYANIIRELADKFKGSVQIAFKPHPLLREKLYNNKDWGKIITDEYFEWWKNGSNTQLEVSDYIDLFNSSDALIHDSGSFAVEYLHTGKPALYLMKENTVNEFNEFGKQALNLHYHAYKLNDIERFIVDVVLTGNDDLRNERELFYHNVLKLGTDLTASINIYNLLCKEIIV